MRRDRDIDIGRARANGTQPVATINAVQLQTASSLFRSDRRVERGREPRLSPANHILLGDKTRSTNGTARTRAMAPERPAWECYEGTCDMTLRLKPRCGALGSGFRAKKTRKIKKGFVAVVIRKFSRSLQPAAPKLVQQPAFLNCSAGNELTTEARRAQRNIEGTHPGTSSPWPQWLRG